MRENLLKKQPTWGLRRAQGTGQKSATPATLTKVILVLLTMFLLPSAAWGGNYNSGTLDTTNKTWGVWKLSDATYSSPQYDYLSFSGAGTITLTLTRPDNTLELIKSITLEIGGTETSSTTTLKSAMIGTTDITSDFVITDNSSLTYTFQPTVPIEWSGNIVITLQGTNNSGSILGAYVQTVTGYGLSVAGVPVTDDNNTNILGDQNSTVSFTPADESSSAPATLTLNGANINYESGNVIVSTLTTPLEVVLLNNSNINSGSKLPFQGAGNTNLVFNISGGDAASLVMSSTYDGFSPTSFYTGFNEVSYEGDLYAYLSGDKIVAIEKATSYGLKVAGVPVTSANCEDILDGDNKGKVSFKPAIIGQTSSTPATLTLNGAKITGGIAWSGSDNLTIALAGKNSITNSDGTAIYSPLDTPPTLTFVKAADATACSLTLTSGTNYSFIYNFAGETYVEPGSGLFYLEGEESATVTSTLLGGGSGTSGDPFLIKTADQLNDFSSYVNNGIITTEFVKLANDNDNDIIDCSSLSDFTPIGTDDYKFKGFFNGGGFTIKNLSMTDIDGEYIGLFRYLESGTISNLTLYECTISGGNSSSNEIGGLVGIVESGTISECTIKNCTISCKQNSQNPSVGGIAGSCNEGGTISSCTVENTAINAVTGDNWASGPSAYAGGVVAKNSGSISGCTVKGETIVTADYTSYGSAYAGAIIGQVMSGTYSSNTYESSVSTKKMGAGDADYITKEGQTQRGIGNESDEIGKIELAGTKSITIGTLVENIGGVYSYYLNSYNSDNGTTTILALPGENVVIALFKEETEKTIKYTITNASTSATIEAEIKDVTPVDGANNGRPYTTITFTMPEADVNIDIDIYGLADAEKLGLSSDLKPSGTYYNEEQSMTLADNIVAYVITGVSGSNVTMTRVNYIPKGVPVYVKMGTSEETPAEEAPASKLKYATEIVTGITTESQLFVLYKDKFVKVTSGTDIPAEKCYLDLSGVTAAGARGFYYIEGGDDGTTAIREVRSGEAGSEKTADGGWHDLQGRRLSAKPTKPGLYILNGKKVVIK